MRRKRRRRRWCQLQRQQLKRQRRRMQQRSQLSLASSPRCPLPPQQRHQLTRMTTIVMRMSSIRMRAFLHPPHRRLLLSISTTCSTRPLCCPSSHWHSLRTMPYSTCAPLLVERRSPYCSHSPLSAQPPPLPPLLPPPPPRHPIV